MADTAKATQARMEKAVIHRDIKLGRTTLEELLRTTPSCFELTPTLVVIDMVPYVGMSAIAELNYEAIRRGINLALPIGALSPRAKLFLTKWERERRKKKEKNGTTSE